jgi:hypothetical protein
MKVKIDGKERDITVNNDDVIISVGYIFQKGKFDIYIPRKLFPFIQIKTEEIIISKRYGLPKTIIKNKN